MDRIKTGSEVHSSSIHEDSETRTLYEMVTAWVELPWDGVQYMRIAESLWNDIDELNLMGGPYGMSVTLLESCIVDSVDGLDIVDNLKKLLENDDFLEGAKIIEVYFETNPVCRISNTDHLLNQSQSIDYLKPEWWTRSVRSYWFSMGGVSIASMIIIYGLMINLGLMQLNFLILSLIVGVPMYAFSYYIRKVATKRMMRVVFIMLGVGIGFWCLVLPIALLNIQLIPIWVRMPLGVIIVVVGAYIGDWLGKRRDYMPYKWWL